MKLFATALLVSTVALLHAQPIPATEGRIYVAVTNDKGVSVAKRDAEAFHVWENGASRPVVAAMPAPEPPSIVLIVHGFGRDEMLDIRQSLTAFIEGLRAASPNARLSLITDVATPVLTDITANAAKLDQTAKRFGMSASNMRLFEAVDDACAALRKEASGRRIILTLTNTLRYDIEERSAARVAQALKSAGASLWSVDVTPESAANTKNQHSGVEVEKLLNQWTIASGGVHETQFGTRTLRDTLSRVGSTIMSQYEVRFSRPDVKAETALQVGVAGVPGDRVIAPQWYVK